MVLKQFSVLFYFLLTARWISILVGHPSGCMLLIYGFCRGAGVTENLAADKQASKSKQALFLNGIQEAITAELCVNRFVSVHLLRWNSRLKRSPCLISCVDRTMDVCRHARLCALENTAELKECSGCPLS